MSYGISGPEGNGTIKAVSPVYEDALITIEWDTGLFQEILQSHAHESLTFAGSWAMYCVVNVVALALMNGNRGKLGAQVGHGYQFADWDAQRRFPDHHMHYRNSMSSAKICLKAPNEGVLQDIYQKFYPVCGVALIRDEGRTVFKEPTVTVLGIGPLRKDKYGDMRLPEIQRDGIAGQILI